MSTAEEDGCAAIMPAVARAALALPQPLQLQVLLEQLGSLQVSMQPLPC